MLHTKFIVINSCGDFVGFVKNFEEKREVVGFLN